MWWLSLAFAGKWDSTVCLERPPAAPIDAELAPFDADRPPVALIPIAYAKSGDVAPRGRWYDEQGRVYAYEDVELALMDHPISGDLYRQYRSLDLAVQQAGSDLVGNQLLQGLNTLSVDPRYGPTVQQIQTSARLAADFGRMLDELPRDRDARTSAFLRAVCLYNLTQPAILEERARQAARMEALLAVRRPEDPPMAAWAVTDQLYAAMGADRPESEVWRADVARVWAALQAGEDADALRVRVEDGAGDTLAARLTVTETP